MTKILTVTNLKGGAGETTASGLLAQYITENRPDPVIVIDVDPQCGTTSLLAGSAQYKLTIKDALVAAMEGDSPGAIMRDALVNVAGKPNLFVNPSDKRLVDMISGIPADLLLYSIQAAGFSDETTIIIDTGTAQGMVGMGMCAADMVLIPVMMSKQTIKPTTNTLQMTARFRKPILGIIPVASGEAQWEQRMLDGWQNTLDKPELMHLGGVVLPRMAYSKSLVRGSWATSPFPSNFVPVFDPIYSRIFGRSAQSIPVPAIAVEEVLNG